MPELSFPWERDAMDGRPMHQNMSLADQKAYQTLALLYGRYRAGQIDRESGGNEKKKILSAWRREKSMEASAFQLARWHAELRKEIEGAQVRYRKNRTLDHADQLSKTLDGVLEKNI